ncbi:MAG: FAD binding domain-containing protein [Actinobacteria bacterium]|nr:FAD binding domain-containing protein [Actinomycetota bacterium]
MAVVGGSLGGLTAALVLRDSGCDVEVFERSTAELEARGAGIAVLDATVRYFVEHDVLDVETVITATPKVRYLEPDGSVQFEEDRRIRFSSWNTIYRALLDLFGTDRYHLEKEMIGFEQTDGNVEVRFEDGTSHGCDLLVCADGIASTARSLLLPQVEPEYAGYVAWRGTVPEAELTEATFEDLRDAITYQLVPDSHILVYPIPSIEGELEPGRRLMNFVWYRNVGAGAELEDLLTDRDGRQHSTSLPPGAPRDEFVDEIRSFAEHHLAPQIAEVVLRTEATFVQVIYDISVPRMAFGRVLLIGDAAFAVRPHAAAGTAKAAEDAWILADVLVEHDELGDALADWERRQLRLGSELLERARAIGNRSQFEDSWVPGDPELAFGLYGPGE